MPTKNKLTPEQREQIIQLAGEGMTPKEIGERLDIKPLRVSGSISYAVKQGQLPGAAANTRRPSPKPPPAGPSPFLPKVQQPEAPMNPSPASAPSPAAPSPLDDQGWRHPTAGAGDGFTHPTQVMEFKVERIEPKDGVLEVVAVEPSDDEIGKRFGSGTYRIWKREGTKMPVFRDVIISLQYGEPRFPNRRVDSQNRPVNRFLQGRSTSSSEEDEDRFPPRPFYRPQMDVRPYQQDGRQMAAIADRGLTAQESIAVTAVNKLAEINEKQMDRMEKERDREREPQSVVADFLKEQQIAGDKRLDEDRKRREEERKAERAEWERREAERDAQHKRDMERIKAENDARIASEKEARQGLMDLEKQRLELMREEAKMHESALRAELERIRTEAKEERATLLAQIEKTEKKTSESISDMEDAVQAELQKEREGLKREHELKAQQLENQRKNDEAMLKLREEILKNQQGEDISKVLTKLVEGVERTVKEVVDLKKIEAVSAEERLAKVGQAAPAGGAANVTQVPGQTAKAPEQPAAMQGQKTGNGHAAQPAAQPEVQPGQETTPEAMVLQLSRERAFVEMISKWAKQIRSGNDAGIFSNMFMELMRDDGTAEVLKVRKACSWFVDEMSTKTWAEMYDFLKPAIPQNLHETFELPHAEVFYDQFKMMVVESVRDYWRAYFASKQAEIEAAKQSGQAQQPAQQSEKQSSPAVVPVAPAMQAVAEAEEPKPEVTVDAA